jgi:L-rhamnose 1-dehydrogenase
MLLEGKTVLITGASRGIGRGTALECARQGADLALNWYRDREGIDETVAAVKALGRRVIEVEGDVAERNSATRFVSAAAKELGGVDVFVSNAGICPFHSFLDTPPETFERTMAVNLHGAYYMTQAAANRMKDQGRGGSIIAISSISALVGGGMQAHYTPTKAGHHRHGHQQGRPGRSEEARLHGGTHPIRPPGRAPGCSGVRRVSRLGPGPLRHRRRGVGGWRGICQSPVEIST